MSHQRSDIISWLQIALACQDLHLLDVKQDTEKGNGFLSDIIFCRVKTSNHETLDLVLKSGKTSEMLLKNNPSVGLSYDREIYMYQEVFPHYTQFQENKRIEDPFKSFPKFYGIVNKKSIQIMALENLKRRNFFLWDGSEPLPRNHIDLVIAEYAKLHATSVAFQEQQPEKFETFRKKVQPHVMRKFYQESDFLLMTQTGVVATAEMLKSEIARPVLEEWLNFKEQIPQIYANSDYDELKVITHGDCWVANFMFKYKDENHISPIESVLIDWQLSTYATPIEDLSYFLFCCVSGEDLDDIDGILKSYYEHFCKHLLKLGSNFNAKYSYESLQRDWKKFAKFGVAMSLLAVKIPFCSVAPDLAASAEKKEDISTSFNVQVNDARYKSRLKEIVEHSVRTGLLK